MDPDPLAAREARLRHLEWLMSEAADDLRDPDVMRRAWEPDALPPEVTERIAADDRPPAP
jgi:hypothetical protein